MSANWVDWGIIAYIAYSIMQGWEQGLVSLLVSLGAFFGSLLLAVRFQGIVGNFLRDKFGLAQLWTSVLGYLGVAFVTEIILSEILAQLLGRVPKKFLASKGNRFLGVVVSGANALLLVTFILLVLLAFPLRGTIRQDIRSSMLASRLVSTAQRFAGPLTDSVDKAAKGAVKFTTIEPKSGESIPLDVRPQAVSLTIDGASEQKMLELVNAERKKVGASSLSADEKMRDVARAHSRDMFERHYFSHYDPEGKDVGNRLDAAGVSYTYAGENLAYAPDVNSAHEGLMNSEGHRANILDTHYHRIGIGVIDAGPDGKMFTQVFAD